MRDLAMVGDLATYLRPGGLGSALRISEWRSNLHNGPPSLASNPEDADDMERWNWDYLEEIISTPPGKKLDQTTPQYVTITGNSAPLVSPG